MFGQLLSVSVLITFSSCGPICENNRQVRCKEKPESGLCAAYFETWFYNKQEDACELISYSGCSAKGFATELECNECKCDG